MIRSVARRDTEQPVEISVPDPVVEPERPQQTQPQPTRWSRNRVRFPNPRRRPDRTRQTPRAQPVGASTARRDVETEPQGSDRP